MGPLTIVDNDLDEWQNLFLRIKLEPFLIILLPMLDIQLSDQIQKGTGFFSSSFLSYI